MNAPRILIAGGGASGFFAAITAAEANPNAQVVLLEKGTHLLAKVGISGGGRCNVTHACFDPRELATRYPRGGRTLIGPLTRFGPTETIDWFQSRNVFLKTEHDGRVFPITDSSQTIIDCLTTAARLAGVKILTGTGVASIKNTPTGGFILHLTNGSLMECDRFLWAAGGCRPESHPPSSLGHTLTPPVPSLFTFHVDAPWLRELAGVSVESVEISVPHTDLKECGPLLFTHSGLSGPAILRLSSWGARPLHELNYHFPLHLNWLPASSSADILREIQIRRETIGAQMVLRSRWSPLPLRLWEQLLLRAGITEEHRWSKLNRETALQIAQILTSTQLLVTGKSMNKEEFVTSGGIPLNEVDFKTMESRLVPGLYFAGEALDIDGLTGGFNFQSAWTTGWIAGHAMASSSPSPTK
jgi:predicted Rossmann fold flavoprotein